MHSPRTPRIGQVAYQGQDMTKQYSLYLVGKDGHVMGLAEAHDLGNDRSANKEANLAAAKYDIEIWEGARLVAYVVADVTKQMPPAKKRFVNQYR